MHRARLMTSLASPPLNAMGAARMANTAVLQHAGADDLTALRRLSPGSGIGLEPVTALSRTAVRFAETFAYAVDTNGLQSPPSTHASPETIATHWRAVAACWEDAWVSASSPPSTDAMRFFRRQVFAECGEPIDDIDRARSATIARLIEDPTQQPIAWRKLYAWAYDVGFRKVDLLALAARHATTTPAASPDDDECFAGLELRDYQRGQLANILASIDQRHDRGLLRAPTQVGKSLLIGPLATAVQTRFPGKKVLVISPLKIITRQLLADLAVTYAGTVGVIDATHKDFTGTHGIVVASAYTLGRSQNLAQLDPAQFGLVIVDEATYVLAATWRRLLTHLGFLDTAGKICPTSGHYLLGLTADPFSLQAMFGGGATITSPGLLWFMDPHHPYLHRIVGLRVRYRPDTQMEMITDGNEQLRTPTASDTFCQMVLETYRRYLSGQKALIYVAQIAHAELLAKAFNATHGEGFAAAAHSATPDAIIRAAVDGYNTGTGPTVLISIGLLSAGYRARGTGGIIHTYEGASLRRYGQRIGRPLGMAPGEAQREILNIDMNSRGHLADTVVTLPRLFGLAEYPDDGVPFYPMKPIAQGQQRRRPRRSALSPQWSTRGLQFHVTEQRTTVTMRGALRDALEAALNQRFANDLIAMATAIGIESDQLDRYFYGALPYTRAEVQRIAMACGIEEARAVSDWEADTQEVVARLYPIARHYGPAVRAFLRLLRRAIILAGGLRGIGGVFSSLSIKNTHMYPTVLKIFQGHFPALSPEYPFRYLADTLRILGTVPEWEWQTALEAACAEEANRQATKVMLTFVGDHRDLERLIRVDHTDVEFPQLPDELSASAQRVGQLYRGLATLQPREERILHMTFGLQEDDAITLEEVGSTLGVSGERVRQIQRGALAKLQDTLQDVLLPPPQKIRAAEIAAKIAQEKIRAAEIAEEKCRDLQRFLDLAAQIAAGDRPEGDLAPALHYLQRQYGLHPLQTLVMFARHHRSPRYLLETLSLEPYLAGAERDSSIAYCLIQIFNLINRGFHLNRRSRLRKNYVLKMYVHLLETSPIVLRDCLNRFLLLHPAPMDNSEHWWLYSELRYLRLLDVYRSAIATDLDLLRCFADLAGEPINHFWAKNALEALAQSKAPLRKAAAEALQHLRRT